MSTEGLAITALGMVSAIGRDVVTSCAAARAGIAQPSELKSLDFACDADFGEEQKAEFPAVHGHPVRGSGDGFAGLGKVLVQGSDALGDLLHHRPLGERQCARTGLVVNISDHFMIDLDARRQGLQAAPSTRWASMTEALPHRLAESRGLALPPNQHVLHRGGNAGAAAALLDAAGRIRRGEVDRCIVGAIDARTDPLFLKAAARLFQLRMIDNPAGLSPGEAAVFCMVERESEAAYSSYPPIARLVGAWTAEEPVDLLAEEHAPSGHALAQVLHLALTELSRKTQVVSPSIFADLNGTQRRAIEWSHALVHLRSSHSISPTGAVLNAMSFGDIGAASGLVAVATATRAFVRGYAKSDTALVAVSSESGAKGAIGLQRVDQ
jgi:3-oxoacyl-[acyl-carrier-protein] synthase-1